MRFPVFSRRPLRRVGLAMLRAPTLRTPFAWLFSSLTWTRFAQFPAIVRAVHSLWRKTNSALSFPRTAAGARFSSSGLFFLSRLLSPAFGCVGLADSGRGAKVHFSRLRLGHSWGSSCPPRKKEILFPVTGPLC